jgi:hypothetical protein
MLHCYGLFSKSNIMYLMPIYLQYNFSKVFDLCFSSHSAEEIHYTGEDDK